ncbi:MAG: T9SS type A sorting domain-containing protein [Ignavibacteriae bacterium]|nr:T9SS type A sorting domain-containing protein [Ignavibacteriota bacterium]
MKFLLIALIIFFVPFFQSKAQSDTLVITLKDSTVKIAVSQIQKIIFNNDTIVGVPNNNSNNFSVKGNYPNPFNEQTNIEFEIQKPGNVYIIIYDNNGVQIQKLECLNCQAGRNILQWDCLDKNNKRVSNGVYYYEVHFGIEVQAKKMLVIGGGK